jgi:uncharacterized protein
MRLRTQLQHVLADLTGRGQHRLIAALRAQVRVARAAVDVASQASVGPRDGAAEELDAARRRVGELESEGDGHRAELVTSLSTTLVTPIDREDLFRLSRSIDDVLDNLRDFGRELALFGPAVCSPLFAPVLDAIADGLDRFDEAIAELLEDASTALERSLQAKKRGNEVRRRYQHAMAELLDGEVSTTMLKRRELLRRLDVVGLRMGEASDALADGVLKRGS